MTRVNVPLGYRRRSWWRNVGSSSVSSMIPRGSQRRRWLRWRSATRRASGFLSLASMAPWGYMVASCMTWELMIAWLLPCEFTSGRILVLSKNSTGSNLHDILEKAVVVLAAERVVVVLAEERAVVVDTAERVVVVDTAERVVVVLAEERQSAPSKSWQLLQLEAYFSCKGWKQAL